MKMRIARHPEARRQNPLPVYQTNGAVGFDLQSTIDYSLPPGERCIIPTGWAVEVPEGYELQIRPRSGTAAKSGITIVNTPGTIDNDYRGELLVTLLNTDKVNTFVINKGDRIAQGVVSPILKVEFEEVDFCELSTTDRGAGGLGSTGA